MEALTPLFGSHVSSEKWRKFVGTTRKVPSAITASQTFCFSTMQKKTNFSRRRCCFRTSGLVMQKRRIERCTQFRCGAGGDIPEARRKKLAVFVSGGGSNFRSIHEGSVSGFINGEVALLVTDKSDCGGAKYAAENDIPVLLFPRTKSSVDGISPVDLVASLRNYEIDFVLLAGYLKLIPNELVQAFPRSILNIHPSLLPAFGGKGYYGSKVHQAVIASGARYSGPTIHYVDEHYDTGRILAQRVVPVLADDTVDKLAKRVLHEEHKLYVEVVAALCEERIIWREDGVPLIRSKENPEQYS